jgi:hypothetical protein
MQWIGEYRRERIEHCGEATCVGSATFEYDYRLVGAQLTLEEPNVPCCGGPPLPPLRGGSARVGAGGIALRSDESSAAFDRLHTRVP